MTANQAETGAAEIQATPAAPVPAAPAPATPAPAPAPPRPAIAVPDFKQMKKKSRAKKYIITAVLLLIAVVGVLAVRRYMNGMGGIAAAAYPTGVVSARDITVSIGGSSAVKAANSYTVTTLISGEILSSPFEEGDMVSKDDVLYTVDSTDLMTTIERAELTYNQSQTSLSRKSESLADLTVEAKEAGTVISMLVKTGDSVMNGQALAQVRDSQTMVLTVPFGSSDAQELYIGQAADVTLDGSYETLPGVITEISRIDQTLSGNILVRSVKIDVSNPGGITPSHTATASAGGFYSNAPGSFAYKSEYTITSSLSGKVARLHAEEGERISAGALLVTLESQTLEQEIENAQNSLRDAELNLQNQRDKLENYTITSPISGTIIEKNYKTGDTLESGRALCTIFDLSWLEMTLNIDELDIYMISVGQNVRITADAAPGKSYTGVVTKVNINGVTQGGVTSYPVTIRIDETDGLLPGMNVDATIMVLELRDVLSVPASAVQRGNRVLVQRDPAAVYTAQGASAEAPQGFEYVTVTTGESDGSYVQILDGLSEGDVIVLLGERVQTQSLLEQFGQRGGGGMVVSNGGGMVVNNGGSFSGGRPQ